jgi:NAD(P)-dependent dehydrogenase (short-subunit alcohol dehydrogenase family)
MPARALFDLRGKTAAVLGGGGALGGAMADALARAGCAVAVADLSHERAGQAATHIREAGGRAEAYRLDAFDRRDMAACRDAVLKRFGRVDALVNAIGGNMQEATTAPGLSFFDLPAEAISRVVDLNLTCGIIAPCQVFGESMVGNADGASIINIVSINALRPLTRIPGYSASKAAAANFTQWLAAHLAREYGPKLRANAVAPGFFLTEQNRYLLTDEATGELTPRGQSILAHCPMGRFGAPQDLGGVAVWLASDASRFVSGTVIPVDGGFTAYSGV